MDRAITKQGLAAASGNLVLAFTYFLFLYAHVASIAQEPRLSILLFAFFESLVLIFALTRRDPSETWHSWWTWATTLGGTFAPLLLRPTSGSDDVLIGQVILVVGCIFQIGALLSLNRSFGLLPAHRGVKTNGLYRCMRHPLYAAYALAQIGYVLNNPSAQNVMIFVFATGLQVMRIMNEETFLLRDRDYADYAGRTRWRLIPLLW
jgi:protein-S-isoprenylcysteine O-methyltransferase Ste14